MHFMKSHYQGGDQYSFAGQTKVTKADISATGVHMAPGWGEPWFPHSAVLLYSHLDMAM